MLLRRDGLNNIDDGYSNLDLESRECALDILVVWSIEQV